MGQFFLLTILIYNRMDLIQFIERLDFFFYLLFIVEGQSQIEMLKFEKSNSELTKTVLIGFSLKLLIKINIC